jgi:hypothetical protein
MKSKIDYLKEQYWELKIKNEQLKTIHLQSLINRAEKLIESMK